MSKPSRASPLTLSKANTRFSHFTDKKDNISYDVFLKLQKGENYEGRATIQFELQKTSNEFYFDWAGHDITSLEVNGKIAEGADKNYEPLRNDRWVNIPENLLKVGSNTIKIVFGNTYTHDGEGLHSFVDTDGRQYLYSQGEVYNMNKIFPTFDQPDLKAVLNLIIAAPKEWVVISNTHIDSKATLDVASYLTEAERDTHLVHKFFPTERVSSYLYAVCAGEYEEFKSEKPYRDIPSSIYCRKSLVEFMKEQAPEIHEVSNETIRVYENFFGVPFPFPKNDHVFVPEFNYGAMENPGCITYTDSRFVYRNKVAKDAKAQRANVISHELGHFWFGDLVTMKWWNDIWLNESFADFISHWCMSKYQSNLKTHSTSDAWLTFNVRKGWGYREDQLSTTHPIVLEVNDTLRAFSIFDGITYAKGAAVLKQLLCLIGEENFGKALQHYFKKFAWGNATLENFVDSLQLFYKPSSPNFPSDLKSWQKQWLETAGLNEVEPVWDPSNQKSGAKLTIKQSAALSDFPTLRHHKMKVGFFNENAEIFYIEDIIVTNGETTEVTYDGSKKPVALFLNYQDESFVKTIIDNASLEFFRTNITKINDELTKSQIWRALFDMVRDGKLSGYQFALMAKNAIPHEPSDDIVKNILLYSEGAAALVPKVLRNNYLFPLLFNTIHHQLVSTDKSKSERIITLVDYLIKFATFGDKTEIDNIKPLIEWFDGKHKDLNAFELNNRNRWDIVIKIYLHPKLTDSEKRQYYLKTADIDPSDEAKKVELRAEAMLANHHQRKSLWKSYLDPDNKLSLHQLQDSWHGFRSSLHYSSEDEQSFFEDLPKIYSLGKHAMFMKLFPMYLAPHGDNLAYYEEKFRELEKKAKEDGNHEFIKTIGTNLDDVIRKRKCYLAAAIDLLRLTFGINL